MDELNIDDPTFDIDNRDIEEEMIQQDIEEEEQEIEEQEIEEDQKASALEYSKNRSILNAKNLNLDLERQEHDRIIYKWRKLDYPDILYSGFVVHRFDDDAYIFEVNSPDGKKLKKFRLSEIRQQS